MQNSMFDILMEIHRVNKEICVQESILQQSRVERAMLETNINNIKELQLKARSILHDTEKKTANTATELSSLHETYNSLIGSLEYVELVSNGECEIDITDLDQLRKERDDLKKKVLEKKTDIERVATKLNETDLQISIQKKKNTAVLLRLRKTLEELQLEEKDLSNKLESHCNI